MTDARHIALDALTRITADNRERDDALSDAGIDRLDARERGFAFTLVMHALRWGRAADVLLAKYIDKPIPQHKHHAQWALRLGVVQLLILKTPAHAAVSTTVDLIKKRTSDKTFAGMTNAVLKKIASGGDELNAGDALPEWLRNRWREAYGQEVMQQSAAIIMQEPPLDISLKGETGIEGERIGSISLRLAATDVTALEGYETGGFWVQDVASTLPVQLLGDVKGKHVLDACAAPGGKTAQLCASGAEVTALDRSPARIKRLKENMQRLQFTPEIVKADLLEWKAPGLFDAVLLDAPCTATGTLRRHPELGWMHGEEDIAKLAKAQMKLLEAVWECLKPGGRLIYSVCSLEPEEGEQQAQAFLKAHPDASLVPAELPEGAAPKEAITKEGYLRTLPSHWAEKGGMDGFFGVCLAKRA